MMQEHKVLKNLTAFLIAIMLAITSIPMSSVYAADSIDSLNQQLTAARDAKQRIDREIASAMASRDQSRGFKLIEQYKQVENQTKQIYAQLQRLQSSGSLTSEQATRIEGVLRTAVDLVNQLRQAQQNAQSGGLEGSQTGGEGSQATMRMRGAITPLRSGYRIYILNEGGAITSPVVDVLYSSPSATSSGLTTRLGGGSVSSVGIERLGMPKPINDDTTGNGAELNEWLTTKNSQGEYNISDVIKTYFGDAVLQTFKDKSQVQYFAIEPIVWANKYTTGTNFDGMYYGTAYNWLKLYGSGTAAFIKRVINQNLPASVIEVHGWLGLDNNLDVAGYITGANMGNKGYGIGLYRNNFGGQTTCDEPLQPSPHDPPDESEGECTIVKSYRLKDGNNNYEHVATTHRSGVDGNIDIENEQGWTVVGWRASSTTNTGVVGAPTWNAPNDKGEGNHAQSVSIKKGECLYVLLEKVEEEPEELGDYDYIISQSRITKKISMSAPVSSNGTLRGITNKEFKWKIAAHPECIGHSCHGCSCNGHSHWDATAPTGRYDASGAPILGKTVDDPCPYGGKDPGVCPGNHYCHEYEYDTSWDGDQQLTLSLDNYLQEDYQDVLVPQDSEEWNVETREAEGTEKGFYNDEFSIDREVATESEEWEESGWDYTCVIMRGKDKLTLAEWINNGEGNQEANEANGDLGDISEAGFYVADTPQGTRKVNDYDDSFRVYLSIDKNHGYDIHSTWKPSKTNPITVCRCGGCRPSPSICTTKKNASSNSWDSGTIKVRVEVYSGASDGGTNDTSFNDSDMIIPGTRLSGYNTTSGRMIQGKTITFIPYIEMQYDKVVEEGLPAFVLSQFSRQVTVNDFAEINWNKQGSENLTIFSNQWSTHAQAKADYGVENVIPGGAQMSAEIKDPDRQVVNVTSYQVVLDGTGLTQVEKTGSYDQVTQTMASALGEHSAYVASITQGLESTSIVQYASDDKDHAGNVWNFGDKVYPGSSLSCIGSSLHASTEDKYYFRDEGSLGGEAQQGDFDVENLGTEMHTYTFYTTTSGGINCSVDNTSPQHGENNASAFMRQLINERTGVETKLSMAVEHGTGNDPEAHTGTTWYNEAFDGITIVVQSTNLRTGYMYPTERINIIDPKLTPPSAGQSENFKDYNVSQYRTENYSAAYGDPYVMGQFKGKQVKMADLDNFYWSRKFWIPDFTTQDQH